MWDLIMAADAANYLMGAGTAGNGDDSQFNGCGIAMSHAYSILAAFNMTDASGIIYKMLLIRNPWGTVYYNSDWNKDDSRWTQALVDQVPFGVDPRTAASTDGLFTVPNSKFIGTACFDSYEIGHNRESEGFVDTWYDRENDDEAFTQYSFTTDSTTSDIYFTVETYGHAIVPLVCTTGAYSGGSTVNYPVAYIVIYKGSVSQGYKYYLDQTHKPIIMSSSNHGAGQEYKIYVQYEWLGSPAKDYTLKVYSKYANSQIKDTNGNTNMLNMDGSSPSGFKDGANYQGWHTDCSRYDPKVAKTPVSEVEVKSLLDVFDKAEDIGEVFEYMWYNPWVCVVWFHFW